MHDNTIKIEWNNNVTIIVIINNLTKERNKEKK